MIALKQNKIIKNVLYFKNKINYFLNIIFIKMQKIKKMN